jgi:hypothetical protein
MGLGTAGRLPSLQADDGCIQDIPDGQKMW